MASSKKNTNSVEWWDLIWFEIHNDTMFQENIQQTKKEKVSRWRRSSKFLPWPLTECDSRWLISTSFISKLNSFLCLINRQVVYTCHWSENWKQRMPFRRWVSLIIYVYSARPGKHAPDGPLVLRPRLAAPRPVGNWHSSSPIATTWGKTFQSTLFEHKSSESDQLINDHILVLLVNGNSAALHLFSPTLEGWANSPVSLIQKF